MTGLCPFIQLSGIDQQGDSKPQKLENFTTQTSHTTAPPHDYNLNGGRAVFNLAECQSTEKPKIEKKVVHPHPAA